MDTPGFCLRHGYHGLELVTGSLPVSRKVQKILQIKGHEMTPVSFVPAQSSNDNLPLQDNKLREAAVQLEATFLAEMLKSAGLGESQSSFGGGAGEEQFSSFLVREQALIMARAGGIGLAESIFHALKGQTDD